VVTASALWWMTAMRGSALVKRCKTSGSRLGSDRGGCMNTKTRHSGPMGAKGVNGALVNRGILGR
jgi:hypothetical protein